jgi:hypothetical protein
LNSSILLPFVVFCNCLQDNGAEKTALSVKIEITPSLDFLNLNIRVELKLGYFV